MKQPPPPSSVVVVDFPFPTGSPPREASGGSLWFGFWPSCLQQLLHRPQVDRRLETSRSSFAMRETSVPERRILVYIYMYIYIYICIYIYIHMYISVSVCVCLCASIYVIRLCICICMCKYMQICTHP